MKTKEILKNIEECGGFHNWRNWDSKEIAIWVKANYNCSDYVAKQVASQLK